MCMRHFAIYCVTTLSVKLLHLSAFDCTGEANKMASECNNDMVLVILAMQISTIPIQK